MILYIITWTIIYLILILILHYLFLFFQKNLTTTKTKDYYNFPNNEYDKINDILNTGVNNTAPNTVIEKIEPIPDNQPVTVQSVETVLPNYAVEGTTAIENEAGFNIDSFNSQFENKHPVSDDKNNMKGELEDFLNKINK